MFKRSRRHICCEYEREEVKLEDGETPKAAYMAWLTRMKLKPRSCHRHDGTPLIFSREGSGYSQVTGLAEAPGAAFRDRVPIPGEFRFHAHFVCRACRVAYALCPPEFHESSFDTFDTSMPGRTETLAKGREFVTQVNTRARGFALFVGPPGLGKTRLACNIIRELDEADSLYVRQGEVTYALRSTYGRKEIIMSHPKTNSWHNQYDDDDEEPETPLRALRDVHFLVLDEIGCTSLANDERLLLDELIKHRYERDEVKRVANMLLTRLKRLLTFNWRQTFQARARVRLAIEETLDTGLPRAYSPELYQQKCGTVFEHIYENYQDAGSRVFGNIN